MGYGVENIQHLETIEAFRKEVNVYLGSKGTSGCYQALKEIINNSTDEAIAGYGDKIEIIVNEDDNIITVKDYGRGVPFGIVGDRNVLVAIYTEPHTGGKFDKNAYKTSSGLHGIGGTAVCLTSEFFEVISRRDGVQARAYFEKGILKDYKEEKCKEPNGTTVTFKPDTDEVFIDADKNFDYEKICEDTENLAFLNKGIHFIITNGKETKDFYSENGISDFIKKNITKPLMKNVIITTAKDSSDEVEVAFIWTGGQNKEYTFVNGLICPEGGAPITGIRRKLTTKIKSLSGKSYDPEIIRKGFVIAVNCKVVEPSFENQTKNKINNKNLATLAGKALDEGLDSFSKTSEFGTIMALIEKYNSAEKAAEKARNAFLDKAKEFDNETKKKSVMCKKLKDCRIHDENSVLYITEGDSALGPFTASRDSERVAAIPIRGKIINALKNALEKVLENEEVCDIFKTIGTGILKNFNIKRLRYGKIIFAADADPDGFDIKCLLTALFYLLAPDLIREGHIYWAEFPLYEISNAGKIKFAYDDAELAEVLSKYPKAVYTRNKGLGEMDTDLFAEAAFGEDARIIQCTMDDAENCARMVELLMGEDTTTRSEYIFANVDFSVVDGE